MLEKLEGLEKRYQELEGLLSMKETAADSGYFRQLSREHSDLLPAINLYHELKKLLKQIDETRALRDENHDPEMSSLAADELKILEEQKIKIEEDLLVMLLPKDPNDDKNIFMEIRGGTGGDEAAIFAGELFRMYTRYAERQKWKVEMIESNPTELGGFKEVILLITGKGVYSRLKFEGGTHRVQRVPKTEAGGRIHTSAATVAVLPEAEDIDLKIEDKELRIDVYRSSGPGGQNVNKTSSAVRITHIPSGLVVACQEERSQHQNRAKAMALLRSRLLEQEIQKQQKEITDARRSMVGTGDRSEKIRTYNFPQNRMTDHRIKYSTHNIASLLDGDLDEMISALQKADISAKIENLNK